MRLCASLAAFSTAPWFGRRGPTERELSRLRCGKTPHRCKSRSAGERALRYIPWPPTSAPWFRIHPAERRVGQARHLVIAFTRSNGA